MLLCVEVLNHRRDGLNVRDTALTQILNDGLTLCDVAFEDVGVTPAALQMVSRNFEGMPVSSIWSVEALYFQIAFNRGLSPSIPAISATSVIFRAVLPLT